MGGTGVFVAALRDALLQDRCDVAVHSLKDLPTGAALGLTLAATPKRADVRDVLCAATGSSSPTCPPAPPWARARRGAQPSCGPPARTWTSVTSAATWTPGWAASRAAGQHTDAVVEGNAATSTPSCSPPPACTGSAGSTPSASTSRPVMLPAAGQGSLAIECRSADAPRKAGSTEGSRRARAGLAALDDPDTRLAVTAERAPGPPRSRLRRPGGRLRVPEKAACSTSRPWSAPSTEQPRSGTRRPPTD